MSESVAEHKSKAPTSITFALITISTSRYRKIQAGQTVENPSGEIISNLLEQAGHKLIEQLIIPDEDDLIRKNLKTLLKIPTVDAVILSGGTGITQTDITIETVVPLFDKELPGFGEVFRKMSYEIIGSSAIITRATAGLINGKVVFCIPGSQHAVEMALTHLIVPEIGHIVKHAHE